MPDNITSGPPCVPDPRPSSDHLSERQAALETLSRRSRPHTAAGGAAVLTDRVLLHTSWTMGRKLLPWLPERIGGLVLAGAEAGKGAMKLRQSGFDRPVIVDPEGYKRAGATEDQPFAPRDGDGLFPVTLEQELQAQRDCGACVALTPTGFLNAGDSDALRAVVRAAAQIDRDDVVVSLPLDVAWFTNEHIDHLIAVLSRLALPKAVFLGGQFNPMERYRAAVSNLRRVVAEAGDVAVLRTDLTGFDALSHGAFATSIGTGGSLRHIVPYGQHPHSSKRDPAPSVLFGELMTFYKGSTLHTKFADTRAPTCACAACQGRGINTFLGKDDAVLAHQHNMCTWASWIDALLAQPTLAHRASWWRNRCAGAVHHATIINTQINQPDAFTAPDALRAWAELPSWLSATQPTTRRSRVE
jgi:hypothetical protein